MVDICSCDVQNKELLALFIHKRKEWKRILLGNGPYSIYNQISHMLWNDAIFRTFNEARRITIERNSPKLGLNGPLIRLLDEGFVASQVMAIRRLTDRNFRDPSKAIISLIRIIDDIKDNSNLITRENYVCCDGTSYEEPNSMEDLSEWINWRRKQENFDKMSITPTHKRDRLDNISRSLLKKMEQNIRVCDSFRRYANKFIAHASDPQTNPELSETEKIVTLDKLDECYRAVVRVSSFLGGIILYEASIGGLPIPQYDHLKNLDKPSVAKLDMKNLHKFWTARSQEIDNWEENLWMEE